jgi:hypothetical protein
VWYESKCLRFFYSFCWLISYFLSFFMEILLFSMNLKGMWKVRARRPQNLIHFFYWFLSFYWPFIWWKLVFYEFFLIKIGYFLSIFKCTKSASSYASESSYTHYWACLSTCCDLKITNLRFLIVSDIVYVKIVFKSNFDYKLKISPIY